MIADYAATHRRAIAIEDPGTSGRRPRTASVSVSTRVLTIESSAFLRRPFVLIRPPFCVDTNTTEVLYSTVTSNELKRWLEKQGCSFASGKGGHLIVRLRNKKTVLPMHGKGHELPTGTVKGIKKALGLR